MKTSSFPPHFPHFTTTPFFTTFPALSTTLRHTPSFQSPSHLLLTTIIPGTDHLQALGLAVLSALRDFPTIMSHFVHTPSFEQKLTSLKPHRDIRLFQDIRTILDSYILTRSPLHLPTPFTYFTTRPRTVPNQAQRRLWNQRFSASPQTPPTPSLFSSSLCGKHQGRHMSHPLTRQH
jgi:hypothetical protein